MSATCTQHGDTCPCYAQGVHDTLTLLKAVASQAAGLAKGLGAMGRRFGKAR